MNEMSLAAVAPEQGVLKDLYQIGEIPPLGHVPASMYAWAIRKERHGPPDEAMQIADEPPPALPAPTPPIAFGWTDEATAPPAQDDAAYTDRFDVGAPSGAEPSAPVIASALLNEPQQEGLRYLFNYANKSIRKNRGISEQDRDDLLHDIYMEWWICTGFEVASLPKLLETDSPYLTPRDLRPQPKARRNEPAFLPHILRAVAKALGREPQEVAAETTRNAQALFGLK